MANTSVTRRRNTLALFQAHAEKSLAAGATPKGLEQAFAATLQISPSMWSQNKSSRPIGDKLARSVRGALRQARGLARRATQGRHDDSGRGCVPCTLALWAWRATDGAGRKALREQLKAIVARQS